MHIRIQDLWMCCYEVWVSLCLIVQSLVIVIIGVTAKIWRAYLLNTDHNLICNLAAWHLLLNLARAPGGNTGKWVCSDPSANPHL
jgi:hypothetical protein